eukprot:Lithocolla_globosa_v1_NODE_10105_length_633_cov_348.385813.p1 type:complete len:142 gc:universal NODE_10105_length_633_cov_348.385813:67-492(+)
MNYILAKEIVYIDSSKRNNLSTETNSDFTFTIELDSNIEYSHVCVLDATLPKSSYSISSNNTFICEENGVQRTIEVPPGNYSRKSFKNVLQNLLNTSPASGYSNYVVSYDSSSCSEDDGKYNFSVTNPSNPSYLYFLVLSD